MAKAIKTAGEAETPLQLTVPFPNQYQANA